MSGGDDDGMVPGPAPTTGEIIARALERVGVPLALLGASVAFALNGHETLAATAIGAATMYLRPGGPGNLPPGGVALAALAGGGLAEALGAA